MSGLNAWSMLAVAAVAALTPGWMTSHTDARRDTPFHRAVDTVDVGVGSPLVSGDNMAMFRTHVHVAPVGAPADGPGEDDTNTLSHLDSAGMQMIRAESRSNSGRTYVLLFNRHTLQALTTPRGAAPPQADSAFLGIWADFVVERLPRRTDVVYRVSLFGPSATGVGIERHLYRTVGRESIDVLGHHVRDAWVVEDRSADGSKLLGRMWITSQPPYLQRWTIYQPNGAGLQIDQELLP